MPWVSEDDWGRARRKHEELRKVVVRIIGAAFLIGMLFGGLTYRFLDSANVFDRSLEARLKLERQNY